MIPSLHHDAQVMKFKGHNAISPCRLCTMKAIPRRSGKNVTYYLTRRTATSSTNPDYGHLPSRKHEEVRRQAEEIERTPEGKQKDRLQVLYGIRGKVRPCNQSFDGIYVLMKLRRRHACLASIRWIAQVPTRSTLCTFFSRTSRLN